MLEKRVFCARADGRSGGRCVRAGVSECTVVLRWAPGTPLPAAAVTNRRAAAKLYSPRLTTTLSWRTINVRDRVRVWVNCDCSSMISVLIAIIYRSTYGRAQISRGSVDCHRLSEDANGPDNNSSYLTFVSLGGIFKLSELGSKMFFVLFEMILLTTKKKFAQFYVDLSCYHFFNLIG